jgi:elongation factor Ts
MDLESIKRLRELTGVGITDAKKALVESKGDFDKALTQMRKKGLTKAEKRGDHRHIQPRRPDRRFGRS